MKLWRLASKKEIDNMTFEEAVEIVMTQVELGHRTGDFRPREHMTKALEIVLAKAEGTKAHWIIEKWPSGWIKRGNCSNCGNSPRDPYKLSKYCDECGAKMDEDVVFADTTTAKWIVMDEYYPLMCTNCHFEYVDEDDVVPNRCPGCGSPMDKEVWYSYK